MNFKSLIKLIQKYRNKALLKKAFALSNKAITIALKNNDTDKLIQALTQLAFNLKAQAKIKPATYYLIKAWKLAKSTNNQKLILQTALNLALILIANAKLNSAKKILLTTLKHKNPRTFYHLAIISFLKANLNKSITLSKTAIKLNPDSKLKLKSLNLITMSLTELGYLKTALKISTKNLFLTAQKKYFKILATFILNHAKIYLYNNNLKKALKLTKSVLLFAKKTQNYKNFAEAALQISIIYFLQNNYLLALKYYFQASKLINSKKLSDQNIKLFQSLLQLIIACNILKIKFLCLSLLANFLNLINITQFNIWLIKLNNLYILISNNAKNQ